MATPQPRDTPPGVPSAGRDGQPTPPGNVAAADGPVEPSYCVAEGYGRWIGSVVCVMSRACVQTYLLADARISARITEILGQRLREMEQRLSDTVFKSVPQRIAATLATLAGQQRRYGIPGRAPIVALTHEQIAALVGTSRETATKILGEFAERGLIRLGRGRITLLDADRLRDQAGD